MKWKNQSWKIKKNVINDHLSVWVYPEISVSFQLFTILQLHTLEICYSLKKSLLLITVFSVCAQTLYGSVTFKN